MVTAIAGAFTSVWRPDTIRDTPDTQRPITQRLRLTRMLLTRMQTKTLSPRRITAELGFPADGHMAPANGAGKEAIGNIAGRLLDKTGRKSRAAAFSSTLAALRCLPWIGALQSLRFHSP